MGTFWAHLGTNQGNLSELHRRLFRSSQPVLRRDLRHAEGSNPYATANRPYQNVLVRAISRGNHRDRDTAVAAFWPHLPA